MSNETGSSQALLWSLAMGGAKAQLHQKHSFPICAKSESEGEHGPARPLNPGHVPPGQAGNSKFAEFIRSSRHFVSFIPLKTNKVSCCYWMSSMALVATLFSNHFRSPCAQAQLCMLKSFRPMMNLHAGAAFGPGWNRSCVLRLEQGCLHQCLICSTSMV